jgi:hypothetical protein
MLLFEPILFFHFRHVNKPEVALLIDGSSSMKIKDNNVSRMDIVRGILKSEEFKTLKNKYIISPYYLSERLNPNKKIDPDSLVFNGTATNISQGLEFIQNEERDAYVGGILLLSDGAHNHGENPLRIGKNLDFPVFSVCVGKTEQKSDILITQILSNEITYVDNEVPVMITFRGPGFEGKRVKLRLFSGKDLLDEKSVLVPHGGMEKNVSLYFTPKKPELHRMTVEISRLDGELTFENNVREFYVRVLKSKFRVLLFASSPSPDLAFIKRLLLEDKNISLISRTFKRGSLFYEGNFPANSEVTKNDLIIFLDFPDRRIPDHIWQKVAKLLLQEKIPLLFFAGKKIDFQKLEAIESIIPVYYTNQRTEQKVTPKLTAEGKNHSVLRIYDAENDNLTAWQKLPPVFSFCKYVKEKPGSQTLIQGIPERRSAKTNLGYPMVIARQLADNKSIVIVANNIYRWDLLMWGTGRTNEVLKKFMENAIRWLVTRESEKTIKIKTNKHIYRSGEDIYITAQIYDETYRFIEKAKVSVKFSEESGLSALQLKDVGYGKYQIKTRIFKRGTYQLFANATLQERNLGADTTEVSVSAYNPEFLDTKANPELLEALANMTNGKSGPPDSLAAIVKAMNFFEEVHVVKKEVEIYNLVWILLIIVFMLSIEWFIRKRKGMV